MIIRLRDGKKKSHIKETINNIEKKNLHDSNIKQKSKWGTYGIQKINKK